jgi:hypothetical protein
MFNIADYLKKFANLEGDANAQKGIIAQALKEVCDLDNVDFEMRKGTLYLKGSPLMKSIVFMKKDKLVEYLRKNYSKGRVSDIR